MALGLFVVPLALVASPAHAGGIAAVLSQDMPLYRETLAGICESAGSQVLVVYLNRDGIPEEKILGGLKAENPDMVIALGPTAARAVTAAMPQTPTVFCMAPAPPKSLAVASLAGQPPASLTGVMMEVPASEQIAAFRRAMPNLSRLGVLFDPSKSGLFVDGARTAAREAGVEIVAEPISKPVQVPDAFRKVAPRVEAIWVLPDDTVLSRDSFEFMLRQSLRHAIPVMVFSEAMVKAGGLMALAPESRSVGRQTGDLAMRLLRAPDSPAPAPEPPRDLRLILNLKVAAALGIKLPEELISRAAVVIR